MFNICKFLHEDDETFIQFKTKFAILEICKRSHFPEAYKIKKDLINNQNDFENVLKVDPEIEIKPFGTKIAIQLADYIK